MKRILLDVSQETSFTMPRRMTNMCVAAWTRRSGGNKTKEQTKRKNLVIVVETNY